MEQQCDAQLFEVIQVVPNNFLQRSDCQFKQHSFAVCVLHYH
jgi:hypothetical protein